MSGSRVLQVSIEGIGGMAHKEDLQEQPYARQVDNLAELLPERLLLSSPPPSSRGASSALERSDSPSSTVLPIFLTLSW